MTYKDYVDLINIYDGLKILEDSAFMLTGHDLAVGYEDGAIGRISRVIDILRRNSMFKEYNKSPYPDYCDDEEITEEEFMNILNSDYSVDLKITSLTGKVIWIDEDD